MTSRKKIIDHISRLEGQLRAIKAELERTEPNCERAAKTLLSSARSFAGLREVFVETFLREKILGHTSAKDERMLESLLALIKG